MRERNSLLIQLSLLPHFDHVLVVHLTMMYFMGQEIRNLIYNLAKQFLFTGTAVFILATVSALMLL